jgi:hypothetical protein
MNRDTAQAIFDTYAPAMAYVEVRRPHGNIGVATAFHVRDGIFVTARHVVENCEILRLATTVDYSTNALTNLQEAGAATIKAGPFFHPDPAIDLAILETAEFIAPDVPIGHLNPRRVPVLTPVLLMGYPPIPLAPKPTLVALTAEVSAVIDSYDGTGPHLILTSMARGGLSGGLVVGLGTDDEERGALGIITRSFVRNGQPEELGYLAALPIDVVYSDDGLFDSKLDWYFSPNRKRWAEQTIRGQPLNPKPNDR